MRDWIVPNDGRVATPEAESLTAARSVHSLARVTTHPRWRGSLSPLRERNFRWYFLSRLVNTLGNMMAGVALAFAVLDITDSATALGQVLAAHTIPMVLFLLWGGVIADRLPRVLIIQVSNVVSGVTQAAIALLVITGTADLPTVIGLSVVHGLASAMAYPAMTGLIPQLVPHDELQKANALLSLVRGGLTVIGPSASALLVVTVGAGWALFVDGLTWLAAAALLLGMRVPRPLEVSEGGRRETERKERADTLVELREGWVFFRRTTWLWLVVLAFCALNAIHSGAMSTLGPVIAKQTIGEQGWGLVLSAESAGLLLMTIVLLRVRLERPLLFGMLAISLVGLPMILLGVYPHVGLIAVAMVLAGAGVEVFNLGWTLAMQENVDESMLSRASSYDALGSYVAMPIGQLAAGPLGAAFGYTEVMVAAGVVYIAICAATLGSASIRSLPRKLAAVSSERTGSAASAGS
jgi:MFS family permease